MSQNDLKSLRGLLELLIFYFQGHSNNYFLYRNLDIRDAILQLLNVIRDGNKKLAKHDENEGEMAEKVKYIWKNYFY